MDNPHSNKVGDRTPADPTTAVHYQHTGKNGNEAKIQRMGLHDHKQAPVDGSISSADNPSDQRVFTVDDAVEHLGFGRFQLLASLIGGLAGVADAMEMMILAVLSPALHCEWQIGATHQAMITTAVFVGMLLSSTLWGKVCDRYGRRVGVITATLLTFCTGALSALAPTFYTFLILRGLLGIGIGGTAQAVTLYAEFLPKVHRAKCLVLIQLSWAVGTSFEALLAFLLMETWGWRWLLFFSSLPLLIFAGSCMWLPESARYHLASGNSEAAYKTLQRVARFNGGSLPEGRLVHSKQSSSTSSQKRGQFRELFVKNLRATTLLLWFIWAAIAFAYYGIVLFTTVLYQSEDKCHGGSGLQPSANQTAITCRPLVRKDYVDLFTTTVAEFPGLFLTALIIEPFGRKYTMAGDFGFFAVFMFLLLFCLPRGWVTAFIFVARTFVSAAFYAIYVYTPEVYPTTLRAIGLGASVSMARFGALMTPLVAQVTAQISLRIPIAIYGVTGLLALVASLALPIETKGRHLPETH